MAETRVMSIVDVLKVAWPGETPPPMNELKRILADGIAALEREGWALAASFPFEADQILVFRRRTRKKASR